MTSLNSYTNSDIMPELRKSSKPFNKNLYSEWTIKKKLDSNDHKELGRTAGATFLRIKAENVQNRSV